MKLMPFRLRVVNTALCSARHAWT